MGFDIKQNRFHTSYSASQFFHGYCLLERKYSRLHWGTKGDALMPIYSDCYPFKELAYCFYYFSQQLLFQLGR
jgi:hypothetical protein